MIPEFVDRLEALGFFKYAASERIASLKLDFQQLGWACIFGESGRFFHADAEDLAEGGVGAFLERIGAFMQSQGVSISADDDFGDTSYWVAVNANRHKIYDSVEMQARGEQPGLLWGLSGARTFAIVNRLLHTASSAERMYAVNGGNDLFGFFLTPVLHEAICSYPGIEPHDKPFVHNENYPWFGMQHD